MHGHRQLLRMGQLLRYARGASPHVEEIDGLPNFHFVTSGRTRVILAKGINPLREIEAVDGARRPAVLISSSPHKVGSHETPWHDVFEPDQGRIRYYGDNKSPGRDPAAAPGNRLLLHELRVHTSPDPAVRAHAAPLLFFLRAVFKGKAKGHVEFAGFGILTGAELVTQYDPRKRWSFVNFAFDFAVLTLAAESEMLDWGWISDRRDASADSAACLRRAPESWRLWIREGPRAVERCRRRVAKLLVARPHEQRPNPGTREAKVLDQILEFYATRKARFEALAAEVAASLLQSPGGQYRPGWITPPAADGGKDFVARLDLGVGFSKVRLVVLGQAKCEKPDSPTSGRDVARTVARLKRGWIGVYVTTSYFSEAVQEEVVEDQYPIVLIPGGPLAAEVLSQSIKSGIGDVASYLKLVDAKYEDLIQMRRPEEILWD